MKRLTFVVLPLFAQLLFGVIVMSVHGPGKEFVGLGVMLMSLVAIPATVFSNWLRIDSHPAMPVLQLATLTFFTTLVFPVLCILLYALAS